MIAYSFLMFIDITELRISNKINHTNLIFYLFLAKNSAPLNLHFID